VTDEHPARAERTLAGLFRFQSGCRPRRGPLRSPGNRGLDSDHGQASQDDEPAHHQNTSNRSPPSSRPPRCCCSSLSASLSALPA
jgi:hypothetical protein